MSLPNSTLTFVGIDEDVLGTATPGIPDGPVNRELNKLLQNILSIYGKAPAIDYDDIESDINTINKIQGKQGWDTTNNRPVWSVGSTSADVWVDADGNTIFTPV
jgi:hypothetical protein